MGPAFIFGLELFFPSVQPRLIKSIDISVALLSNLSIQDFVHNQGDRIVFFGQFLKITKRAQI
jgi:hypothetical protein